MRWGASSVLNEQPRESQEGRGLSGCFAQKGLAGGGERRVRAWEKAEKAGPYSPVASPSTLSSLLLPLPLFSLPGLLGGLTWVFFFGMGVAFLL